MTALRGTCHCGAVTVMLDTPVPAEDLPLRACQCGFCRRHGAATTSHPDAHLFLEFGDVGGPPYRFGRGQADVLVCHHCGVYVASMLDDAIGMRRATLNVVGVDLEGFRGRAPEPVDYEHETDRERLARRGARWTPTTVTAPPQST